MTADANSLTARVTGRNAAAASTMTMPAHTLRVFLDSLGRLGHNVDALLASARLQLVDLEDPDGRVPCEAYGAVLTRAQQERFTPNLALELARVTPLGAWPLMDYLVVTADTVEAGVRQLARYVRITGAPFSIDIRDEREPVRVEMTALAAPFAIEFEAALMVLHFREEAQGVFSASLSFTHTLDDAAAFARILGCPVTSNAPWSGISVPLETWRLPLRRRDPTLRQVPKGAPTRSSRDCRRAPVSHWRFSARWCPGLPAAIRVSNRSAVNSACQRARFNEGWQTKASRTRSCSTMRAKRRPADTSPSRRWRSGRLPTCSGTPSRRRSIVHSGDGTVRHPKRFV